MLRELTTRASPTFAFRIVRGVLPRSLPGVLNISATFLLQILAVQSSDGTLLSLSTDIWFSLKISAMCSFSHSKSFLAEKLNSSTSELAICCADDLSSATHGAEPTCNRVARGPAIAKGLEQGSDGKALSIVRVRKDEDASWCEAVDGEGGGGR